MAARARRGVFLTKLALKNIKSFAGDQTLDLTDAKGHPARWTLLLGENTVGKTTLLECLAYLIPVFNDDSEESDPHFEPLLIQEENAVIEALGRVGERECRAKAEFATGAMLDRVRGNTIVEMSVTFTLGNHERADSIEFSRWPEQKAEGDTTAVEYSGFKPPLVLAYGAGRHMGVDNLDFDAAPGPTASLFSGSIELFDADRLLRYLDYASLGSRASKALTQKKVLLETMAALLPEVETSDKIKIYRPSAIGTLAKTGVYVRTSDGEIPLRQLSFGYQTMMAWAADIGWRLCAHYPNSRTPLNEPAIVLIDEIDLHLHPSWQRDIRDLLTDQFPNVQFIATAHSPLIAQAFLDANLAVIIREGDHSIIENEPARIASWRVDQVVTSELFGLETPWPPLVDRLFEEHRKLSNKAHRTSEDDKRLKQLEAEMLRLPTEENPDDEEAFKIIREAAQLLRPKIRKA
jgi:predicted ATP-binding protein involved in virulence